MRFIRYPSSSPKWFQARDGLRGTDEYGDVNDAEYSIYYSDLLKPDTEILFVIGLLLSTNCQGQPAIYCGFQDPLG